MRYIDLAFLRSYHDARRNGAWLTATPEVQEWAMATADEWLARRYPGKLGNFDEVPTEVLFASAEAALAAVDGEIDGAARVIDGLLAAVGIVPAVKAPPPVEPEDPEIDPDAAGEAEASDDQTSRPRRGRPPKARD